MALDNTILTDGGPEKPTPPAGYTPITPQQRGEWNTFLDYLKGQGNINLSDPQVGLNFFNQYKQNNPNFSLTAEQIPFIQYENNQLRTGQSLGDINADQLKTLRSGLTPNFLNTTDTYKSYYPQYRAGSQNFGTNYEDYLKYKSGGPVTVPTAIPPTAAPVSNASPTIGTIPKPDYSNPQSRLDYAHAITKQYGPLMQGRGDTFLKVNEVPETDVDTQTPKEFTNDAAKKLGLNPSLLYASAMEEGMSGLWHDKKGQIDASWDDDYPISGFVSFGLDNFSDAFPGLVKKGYLDNSFKSQFKKSSETNEKDQKVNSANFKSAAAAMQAKAAMIRDAQDVTDKYAKTNGIPLSERAKDFFTLVNYNAGEGNMRSMMKEYFRNGFLKDDKFLDKRPSDSWKGPYENVIRRIKAADVLKKEGLWEDQ